MVNTIMFADGTTIDNIKSVSYKCAVNAEADLRPGCVSSGCVTVEVYDSEGNAPSAGTEIYVDMDVVPIGRFYVEPYISTKNTYSFVAYDAVNKLNVDYSARLADIQTSFPMTLADLVLDACSVAGVELADDEFPMYDMEVQAFYANGITCRDILSYAAEIACCFVRAVNPNDISDPDTIEFAWYEDAEDLRIYPTTQTVGTEDRIAYKQNGLSYSKYVISPPPQVAVKPSGVEGAAYIYPSTAQSVYATDPNGDGVVTLHNLTAVDDGNGGITLSGDFTAADEDSDGNVVMTASGTVSGEPLIISDNILLNGADSTTYEDVAENIYTRMNLIPAFRSANVAIFPTENPFELGQIIPVTDAQGVSFYMLSMSESISAAAAVFESFGNETRASEPSNTQKSLTQLASDIVQINKLKVGWAEIDQAIINTVQANELKSEDFVDSQGGVYAQAGMAIDLADKTIKATNFAVTSDGKVYADGGKIAGMDISASLHLDQSLPVSIDHCEDSDGNTISYTTSGSSYIISARGTMIFQSAPLWITDTIFMGGLEISLTSGAYLPHTIDIVYLNSGSEIATQTIRVVPGATVIVSLLENVLNAADNIQIFASLLANDQIGIGAKYYQQRGSLHYGTESIGGGADTFYVGLDGISIGNKVKMVQSGRADFGSIYVGGARVDPDRFSAASGESQSVGLPNSTRGVILLSSVSSSARGMYFFSCNSSGTVLITTAFAGSDLTLTAGTNSVSVANAASGVAYGIVIYF